VARTRPFKKWGGRWDSNPSLEVRLTLFAYPAYYLWPTGITKIDSGRRDNLCFSTGHHQKMGWTMGLEPTTTGITTRGSTN
jgi:hypothetical protein